MEEKELPKIKRDWAMKFKAWGLWYIFCFITGLVAAFFFFAGFAVKDLRNDLPKILALAAVIGLVLEVLLFGVVFPLLMGKQKQAFKAVLTRISSEGYTPEVMNMLLDGYTEASASTTSVGYANTYALYLCDAFVALKDYERAWNYLSAVNTDELFRYNFPGLISEKVIWYSERIQLAALMGNIPAAEHYLREAEAFFREIRGKSPAFGCIADSAVFEYFFAVGDLARCETVITPYLAYKELKFGSFVSLGRVYAKRGDSYAANRYFDSAMMCAKNDFFKALCERERSLAIGG